MNLRVFIFAAIFLVTCLLPEVARALPLSCGIQNQISQQFTNGAVWDMCWERRAREGIVLREVHYTEPGGHRLQVSRRPVLRRFMFPMTTMGLATMTSATMVWVPTAT